MDVNTVSGVRLASAASGLKYRDRDDICLIELAPDAACSCVFTTNRFRAAPVLVAETNLRAARPRYLVINAGNANAGTGAPGEADARAVCAAVAAASGVEPESVLPFSTGVIGERLDANALNATVPDLMSSLAADGWPAAAAAIMTTDTRPKLRSTQHTIGGCTINVTGIAKGSGMIKPDMATMLAYVATDAAVEVGLLDQIVKEVADQSFNRITVDGDTSTNDALALIATGANGMDPIANRDDAACDGLVQAMVEVCAELARDIVRDGEGATKFVTIRVSGAASEADCRRVAYTVAESPLVKTALFASDPNWGRILAAIGRAGISEMAIDQVRISIGDCLIVADGEPVADYDEDVAAAIMSEREIDISISLGSGAFEFEVWTCDFSYDYVKINAEYRS